MVISLVMSSSVSVGLDSLAIFKTSLISLLPVFHTEEAICIQHLNALFDYYEYYYFNSSYVYFAVTPYQYVKCKRDVLMTDD
jgi:hypothetical protein